MENSSPENIHPIFDGMLDRSEKEQLLNQKARVIWLTGLSGSGKSTIAKALEKELYQKRYLTKLLDGDNIRSGLNKNLKFSLEDREENIRRISEVSKLFLNCGIITINSFISPTVEIRQRSKDIIGAEDYIEIFVDCPIEVCEKRDVKGLYEKARKGEIENFTGINAPFEKPENADLTVDSNKDDVDDCVNQILEFILPKIKYEEGK